MLLITGTVGAGKTTVAREVGELLRRSRATTAVIDLDSLSYLSPGAEDDRFNSRFVLRNLTAVWPNYAAAGVDHLVLARFLGGVEELAGYRAAIPGSEFVVCRLTAPAGTVQERVRNRELGVARAFLAGLARRLAQEFDALGLEDFAVDNGDHRSITDVAQEVLMRAGWPAAAERVEGGWVMDDDLLAEQRAFYRARAPEYDEWWQGRGRYQREAHQASEWAAQVATVEAALTSFDPAGDVLELAGGTGWWTERLARTAQRLTVVDASPETLELNRERVRRPDVEYHVADLFSWRPHRTFDVAFFSFWLSHVPRSRFGAFWSLVRACVPSGRVFLVDNRSAPTPGHVGRDPYVIEYAPDLHRRRLADGSEYRVVKVTYEPEELARLLQAEGWDSELDATKWFVFGSGTPR